jgi:hypothetical protein
LSASSTGQASSDGNNAAAAAGCDAVGVEAKVADAGGESVERKLDNGKDIDCKSAASGIKGEDCKVPANEEGFSMEDTGVSLTAVSTTETSPWENENVRSYFSPANSLKAVNVTN